MNVDIDEAYNTAFKGIKPGMLLDPGLPGWTSKTPLEFLRRKYPNGSMIPVLQKQFHGELAKATSITGAAAGTADKVRIPLYLDPDLVDRTRIDQPFLSLVPKRTNYGRTAEFDYISTVGAANWEAEDASGDPATDTKTRSSTPIKYLRAYGRVTGAYEAATRQFFSSGASVAGEPMPDANAEEIKLRSMAMVRKLGDTVLDGDVTTYPLQFDGVFQLITNDATTVTDKATTGSLAISDLRTSIRGCMDNGANRSTLLGVCDLASYDDIKALLQSYLRYPAPTQNLAWGIESINFEGIPIIADRNISSTGGSKWLAFVDMEQAELRELQPMSYEPLAKTNDSRKFMMKQYCTFIMKAPNFCALIKRIA